ncbi:ferredoxin [Streptomyces sp. NPDC007162]|uniref:ferredoxin n=1 Tax=Streptomyces sp. NPDC007162 TaxID=3156917 RepID=UPI0033FCE0B4
MDIDRTSCQAHGLCAELLPEHITLDEWGYPWSTAAPYRPAPGNEPAERRRTARSWP